MYPTAVANYVAQNGHDAVRNRNLVVISARNKATDTVEKIGVWDGIDHEDFTVGGETLTFYGAASVMEVPALVAEVGLAVRRHRFRFNSIAPEIADLVSLYDLKGYTLRRYLAVLDAQTNNLVAPPFRVFEGEVMSSPDKREPEGGAATLEIVCAGATSKLDRGLPLKKSKASHQLRYPSDLGFQYSIVTGVEITWGETSEEFEAVQDVVNPPEPIDWSDLGP